MATILGLGMIYVWIHSVIVVGKKIGKTTGYENFVLIASLTVFVLYIIGTLMG